MNIKKIINDKIKELFEGNEIKEKIEESIEGAIKNTIKETFSGYSFERKIKEKLEKEIDPILESVDLSAYKNIIHARVEETIKGTLDSDLAEKALNQYNLLFGSNVDKIKLSTILKSIKENFIEDDYYDSFMDNFYIEFEHEYDGSFERINIFFDREGGTGKNNADYKFRLSRYEDGDYSIYNMELDYRNSYKDKLALFRPGYLNDFERILMNAYHNGTKIEVDVDVDMDVHDIMCDL